MRRIPIPVAAALILGQLAAGCTDREILRPGDEQTLLIAAVVAGSDSVYISVGRSGVGRPNQPAQAEMVLHRSTGEIALVEAVPARCAGPSGFACYVGAAAPPIAVGESVSLSGTIVGVGPVSGSTTVPPVPEVSILDADGADTVHIGSLSDGAPPVLLFAPGPGALAIAATPTFELETTVWNGSATQACWTRLLLANQDLRRLDTDEDGRLPLQLDSPRCNGLPAQGWDSVAITLPVLLHDESLSARLRSGPLIDNPSRFGLEGIHGVFGSASVRVLVLTVLP